MSCDTHSEAEVAEPEDDDPDGGGGVTISFAFPLFVSEEITVPEQALENWETGDKQDIPDALAQWWMSLSDEEKLEIIEFDQNTSTSENLIYLDLIHEDGEKEVIFEQ
jgi:hypothetical protein